MVDRVIAEDTRRVRRLLAYLGLRKPTLSLHEHNERERVPQLLEALAAGEALALVCDAGTPLVSDPGYHLVRAATAAGIRAVPVPGPSAVTAALSVAGLPAGRFVFEGFLPARAPARRERLAELGVEPRTVVFFEAPHRIVEALEDAAAVFGEEREAAIARELTKVHETVRRDRLGALCRWLRADPEQQKGEFVVVVRGVEERGESGRQREGERVTMLLLEAGLSVGQAAGLGARITGARRNALYEWALKHR